MAYKKEKVWNKSHNMACSLTVSTQLMETKKVATLQATVQIFFFNMYFLFIIIIIFNDMHFTLLLVYFFSEHCLSKQDAGKKKRTV